MRLRDMDALDILIYVFIYTSLVTFPVLVGLGLYKTWEVLFR